MQHAGRTTLGTALLLLGCSQDGAAPTTPRYPSAPRHEQSRIEFAPAAGLTRLLLPCTKLESPIDNGLDDNCDGRIDRQAEPTTASLFIALSHSTQVDVELALTAGSDPSAEASLAKSVLSREQVCQGAAPFAVQQAAFPQLAKGRYEVALVHGKVCGAELPATVDASLWLQGLAQGSYGVSVAPGGRTLLGTIEVR